MSGLLDGVAIRHAICRHTAVEHFAELELGRAVKIRAKVTQQLNNRLARVGLECVVHLGVREAACQLDILLLDNF